MNLPGFIATWGMLLCLITVIWCVFIGCQNPKIKTIEKFRVLKDLKVYFLIDVSRSMVFAEDLKPNRLEAVKKEIKHFYINFPNDMDVGIIPFSGVANPYFCPPTSDRANFLKMLSLTNREACPSAGTDLLSVVEALKKVSKDDRCLVFLISDGGREESEEVNVGKIFDLIKEMNRSKFYTIAVGGDLPCKLICRDESGFALDEINDNGIIGESLVDEKILRDIATIGNGEFLRFSKNECLSVFFRTSLEKSVKDFNYPFASVEKDVSWFFYALASVFLLIPILGEKCLLKLQLHTIIKQGIFKKK
jgi:hypothetical protein